DYLRVEYEITLNTFGKKASDSSIPPPRSTTSIKSEATVPDQCTIVVGGLQNADESKTVDKIPLLGDIPLIGYAFRNTSISKAYKTTYLFITPSIIKRDDFSDLKQVSDKLRQEVKNNAKHQTSPKSETKATD
ncbi:MAG: hypothetical protein NTX52_00315, partial [Planctomycetota bacterium]|nr:hypothetical protein [Planctomycetota bacterium]